MLNTTDVLIVADQLMQERYGEAIRSRQIKILAEALVCCINEEFARRSYKPPKKNKKVKGSHD